MGCIQSASIQKVFEAFDGCLSPFLEMLPPCGTQGLQRVLEGSYGSAPRWRSSSNIYSYTSIIRVESFLWAQGKLQWTLWTVCYFRICGISLHSTENKLMWVSCLKGRKTFFLLKKEIRSLFLQLYKLCDLYSIVTGVVLIKCVPMTFRVIAPIYLECIHQEITRMLQTALHYSA